jgi:hypothetical protein
VVGASPLLGPASLLVGSGLADLVAVLAARGVSVFEIAPPSPFGAGTTGMLAWVAVGSGPLLELQLLNRTSTVNVHNKRATGMGAIISRVILRQVSDT